MFPSRTKSISIFNNLINPNQIESHGTLLSTKIIYKCPCVDALQFAEFIFQMKKTDVFFPDLKGPDKLKLIGFMHF